MSTLFYQTHLISSLRFQTQKLMFLYARLNEVSVRKCQNRDFRTNSNKTEYIKRVRFNRLVWTLQHAEYLCKHQMHEGVRLQHTVHSLPAALQEIFIPKQVRQSTSLVEGIIVKSQLTICLCFLGV